MARHPGIAVADELRPDGRTQAIGAHQEVALDGILAANQCAGLAAVLRVARDRVAGTQLDIRAGAAGRQHRRVQVAPMHHGVRIAEACTKRCVEGNVRDFLACRGIHQPQLIDVDGAGARLLADAESVEGMKRVRAELDTGSDLAELLRLLEDDHAEALARQPEGCREPTDAAARDDDRLGCHGFRPPLFCLTAHLRRAGRQA